MLYLEVFCSMHVVELLGCSEPVATDGPSCGVRAWFIADNKNNRQDIKGLVADCEGILVLDCIGGNYLRRRV